MNVNHIVVKRIECIKESDYLSIEEALKALLLMLKELHIITVNSYKSMAGMLKSKKSSKYAVLRYIRKYLPRVGVIPGKEVVKVVFIGEAGMDIGCKQEVL